MAENFPRETTETGEKAKDNKRSRIQKMLASLLKRERQLSTEITEDAISAKSAIQFVTSTTVLATQSDDEED